MKFHSGLNPCCNGQWSRTLEKLTFIVKDCSLNPCCSGQWSRTYSLDLDASSNDVVLILIVVEDGLVLSIMIDVKNEPEKS